MNIFEKIIKFSIKIDFLVIFRNIVDIDTIINLGGICFEVCFLETFLKHDILERIKF
jgi:hypothetical protein